MSRRVILLVTLSTAAIFLASFVLLQDRSNVSRPLFPKPWGSDSASGSDSWLKQHLDSLSAEHESGAKADDGSASSEPDEQNRPETPALVDSSEGKSEQVQAPSTGGADDKPPDDDDTLPIWMLEVGGSHDEVFASLIHAFGTQPKAQLELYLLIQRFGINDIIKQFELTNPMADWIHKSKFNTTERKPRIMVSTTCEFDVQEREAAFTEMMEAEGTYMFCVVHHADRWVANKNQRIVQPWVERGLVDFICLSKHSQNFLDAELQKWKFKEGSVKPVTRHLAPVFPVDLSKTEVDIVEDELSFSMQGNFDPTRRDYNKIFEHLGKFLNDSTYANKESNLNDHDSHPDIQLHLLGHGNKPEVPEELQPHVKFDERLEYLKFYGIISRTFALLPGFASPDYYDRKASSTVPASLIAGVPLVATQKLLDAYTYVPAEAVWLQGPDEEDFDVIGRILAMKPEERKKKKEAVRAANKKRIEMNKVLTAEWIREGEAKLRKLKEEKKNTPVEPEVMEGIGSKEVKES